MKIGFIGVGSMGQAMIPLLARAGHEIAAWNRTADAVRGLEQVRLLDSPAAAFSQDVVITMLANDAAIQSALIDAQALNHAQSDCVHIVMSTLSPFMTEQLQALHQRANVALIAAPVFGIPAVAARGELNILAAGPQTAIDRVQPLFDVLGKATWRLGDMPVQACVAKIAGNLMITQAISALAEATLLTESYGLPAERFVEVVTQTLFACPIYQRYGHNIVNRSYAPGFKLSLGLKDVNLAIDAAQAKHQQLPAANVVRNAMMAAVEQGLGTQDWSAFAETIRNASSLSHS
jgi:3-hydroxyisobutyrate dehydrogenase-like beta-hydroxyacid dehydrogenase